MPIVGLNRKNNLGEFAANPTPAFNSLLASVNVVYGDFSTFQQAIPPIKYPDQWTYDLLFVKGSLRRRFQQQFSDFNLLNQVVQGYLSNNFALNNITFWPRSLVSLGNIQANNYSINGVPLLSTNVQPWTQAGSNISYSGTVQTNMIFANDRLSFTSLPVQASTLTNDVFSIRLKTANGGWQRYLVRAAT